MNPKLNPLEAVKLRLGVKDICDTCGEFETIQGIKLDGKRYCLFCLQDEIITQNTVLRIIDPEPLHSATIKKLQDLGWLKDMR